MIVHLDMDSFYVSVERLLDPSLVGKPVAVGGTPEGRGVVASASYEARAYGVRSAMPMGQALRLCPHLVVVSSSFSSYSRWSRRIHELLLEFTPLVQMASQDEAYLDLEGTERLWGPALRAAQLMRDRILAETKLPCSLGVGANKLVAKIASALCKPRGLMYIPEGSEALFLAPLPVKRLPGIGGKTQKRLAELGIATLGEIAAMDDARARRIFGDHGMELRDRARGISHSEVAVNELPKSISAEETFARDTLDREFLEGILSNLCEKVAYRVRGSECRAATITVKYRYKDFETHTASRTLTNATDDESEMLRTARELLAESRDPHRPIRLLGVAGGNLQFETQQMDFLEVETNERRQRLHKAIDSVRNRHGYKGITRASSGGKPEEKKEDQWG